MNANLRVPICGVYCFTYTPDGRKYVGSSHDVFRRRNSHFSIIRGKKWGGSFHREAGKLGIENFTFEVLEECAPEIRAERELFHIQRLNAVWPNGFNLREDPTKAWSYEYTAATRAKLAASAKGRKHSPETRAKMAVSIKAALTTPEMRALFSKQGTGRKHSPEAVAKMKEARARQAPASEETRSKMSAVAKSRGVPFPPEKLKEIADSLRGIPRTDEVKAKISAARMGHEVSEEMRRKISEKLKGRPLSQETRERMSAARKGIPKSPEQIAKFKAAWVIRKQKKAAALSARNSDWPASA